MPRPRFQFRLRTLFVAVTLAAVACGVVGWQARIVARRKAWIHAHPQNILDFPYAVIAEGKWEEEKPSGVRRWLGDKGYGMIVVNPPATHADAMEAAILFPEANINEHPIGVPTEAKLEKTDLPP